VGKYVHSAFKSDISPTLEREAARARRVAPRSLLQRRRITVAGRVFVAFSAHEILEAASEADRARPGHVHG
jgi:hypothetical protein